jgi:hypothetical protein
MILKLVRFLSLLAVALTLGLTFAHVLEIPGKLRLSGADWLTVQHNLYVGFGTVGAAVEIAAIALAWLAAILVRDRRPAFAWTLAAALLATAGLVAWGLVVAPVNTALAAWTPETLPADWTAWRNRWELGHALHAGLFALAFGCLAAALLAETPRSATLKGE